MSDSADKLRNAAANATTILGAIYEWLDRIEKAGGTTSLEGIAVCHAFLKSLRKNAQRTEDLIMKPMREAVEETDARNVP